MRITGDSIRLDHRVRVDVDELVAAARQARENDATVSLLSGQHELLPGWFEDWVLFERERLRQLYLHTLETFATASLRRERFGDAVEAALASIRAEPLRESPYRLLIEVHLAEGNFGEALRTYQSYRALLGRELGVAPSPMIRKLVSPGLRLVGESR